MAMLLSTILIIASHLELDKPIFWPSIRKPFEGTVHPKGKEINISSLTCSVPCPGHLKIAED